MRVGQRIGGRFDVEAVAGSGGMGIVYRCRDASTGQPVALKVLNRGESTLRFDREARLLAELDHPAIVRFVAQGVDAESGASFLAMEWLEGEDLRTRLRRTGLSIVETLALARRIAGALAQAHARGVVHRDLKPSNIYLAGGDPAAATLLDFGIARAALDATRFTETGAALGTPGYMAPEQARGDRDVGPRADVFSLGCVLFHCLTGRPAFYGDHAMATLAKILLEDAPRPREIRDEIPRVLDDLVIRMLAKEPPARPADAAEVLARLDSLDLEATSSDTLTRTVVTGPSRPALSAAEQRLASIVMLAPEHTSAEAVTLDGRFEAPEAAIARVGRRYGAHVDRLVDGWHVLTLPDAGAVVNQVARAASCALALAVEIVGARVALATGRAALDERLPIGAAIDRATTLARAPRPAAGAVRVDEVTRSLLADGFECAADENGALLLGRHEAATARKLLGQPTPCVGRDAELATLEAMITQCIDERAARTVLITAPAGVGKSRLRYEMLRRVRARDDRVEIWLARGEPIGAGGAFALAAQIVRGTAEIHEGEPIAARREKLHARVARHVAPPELARVVTFLGEMIGTRVADESDLALHAARADAVLMGDQIRRAWEDFVDAETAAGPLLIVLEDLHWGDVPTVRLIDSALRLLPDRPLMVVGLARPEVDEQSPGLFAKRDAHRIALGPLSRRAAERLVGAVLRDASPERVARIVDRAAGNAFYLEELIRFEAEGGGEALPETVLAMVEARLAALEPDARRVLRAASVFGQVFWDGGVAALLGDALSRSGAARLLAELARREIVTPRPSSRFPGEPEHVFRHALVREAAYAMLKDEDRTLGHRLAAEWLEATGEGDAMILAEHFERGADHARAAREYLRAAEQALEGDELVAAIDRAGRGIEGGASGDLRAALLRVQGEAYLYRAQYREAAGAAAAAVALVAPGSGAWGEIVGTLFAVCGRLGDTARMVTLAREIISFAAERRASAGALRGGARGISFLVHAGHRTLGIELLDALEAAAAIARPDPILRGRLLRARATLGDTPMDYALSMRAAESEFETAGDRRSLCVVRGNLGHAWNLLGAFEEAEQILRDSIVDARRMGLDSALMVGTVNLGWTLARLGKLDEAAAMERGAAEALAQQSDRRTEGGARTYLAAILQELGDLEGAEAEARRAVELLAASPPLRIAALGVLGSVLRERGVVAEARDACLEAVRLAEGHPAEDGEALARLVLAEILAATGDPAAESTLQDARDRLLAQAAKVTDPARRRSFLERIPEHARTLALAG